MPNKNLDRAKNWAEHELATCTTMYLARAPKEWSEANMYGLLHGCMQGGCRQRHEGKEWGQYVWFAS